MFLTIMYAGFAALTFAFAKSVIEELSDDEREMQMTTPRSKSQGFVGGYDGYIGERFDVRRNAGFVGPQAATGALT